MALAHYERSGPVGDGDCARRLGWTGRARLAGEILIAYLKARRALAGAPIATVVSSLRQQPPRVHPRASDNPFAEARRLGRAVSRTLVLLPGDTRCLVRSLVLAQLLARRGIPATLVIGARAAPEFLAHAWVEHGGRPVLSPGDGSFGRLVEL
jgi:Transglutaminase-like superfamily